jgi:hypothetical protein
MSTSRSPVRAPRILEPKDSHRLQQTPRFIPASHMPKRQANSLPFQDPILHISPPNTHAASIPSRPTLRDAYDPMQRNMAYELEHSERLPVVYEKGGAVWTIGRDTAAPPGVPYLSPWRSNIKLWQGSPSTADHALGPRHSPRPTAQSAVEYRRRNLVNKPKTPFRHKYGVWDELPIDLEAVARAQKRGLLSKRKRAGRLFLKLLGRNGTTKHQSNHLDRTLSLDSYFNGDMVGIPVSHSTITRTGPLELRSKLHRLLLSMS